MNSITFGREHYHLNDKMEQWCYNNIGKGSWTYTTPETWDSMDGKIWAMHSMFGNTTFCFKDEKDHAWFV